MGQCCVSPGQTVHGDSHMNVYYTLAVTVNCLARDISSLHKHYEMVDRKVMIINISQRLAVLGWDGNIR